MPYIVEQSLEGSIGLSIRPDFKDAKAVVITISASTSQIDISYSEGHRLLDKRNALSLSVKKFAHKQKFGSTRMNMGSNVVHADEYHFLDNMRDRRN